AGTYYWKAVYTGDTNNNGFTTTCGDANEELVIGLASPTFTTQASPTTGTSGVAQTVGDSATFSGVTDTPPTGSVTFTLYSDIACTAGLTPAVTGSGTISLVSGKYVASYSQTGVSLPLGTYYWKAVYTGDTNNNGFTTTCGDANEELVIGLASPTFTTQARPTTGTSGVAQTVGDSATFSGVTDTPPTGSVTFTLYSNATCTATLTPAVTGSGAISLVSGKYVASYSQTGVSLP